ncbi:MAG TPA: PEPxxWA-CTERM sorting domain-containing protein [Caulobacteraceae bacterium]|jgi:hypothetical protein|nr:PEPxxWA-CTERM sorting domain-containing protein [Caulobacteraceae bacterium]
MARNTYATSLTLAAILAAGGASAITLTPIAGYVGTYGGYDALGTQVLGINNAGWMTGDVGFGYIDPVTHVETDTGAEGFIRAPDGTYTLFTAPGATFTFGRAINADNTIVGYATGADNAFDTGTEFTRSSVGAVSVIQSGGVSLSGIAQGINSSGDIVGDYFTNAFPNTYRVGFSLTGGSFSTGIAPDPTFGGNAAATAERGIDDAGDRVGFLIDHSNPGQTYGWYKAAGGSLVLVSDSAYGTYLEAINNSGLAAGANYDVNGNAQAFIYSLSGGTYTNISIPGSSYVQSFGLNDMGQVAVNSDVGSYVIDLNAGGAQAVFMPIAGGDAPPNVAQFQINVTPGVTYELDPASASGFIFSHGTGPLFASVTAPTGVAPGDQFQLLLYNGADHQWEFVTDITGGVAYDFSGAGVGGFELLGIPRSYADDPTSFIAGVTFETAGAFNGEEIAVGVPEPAAWTMMILGVGLAGAVLRSRRRRASAS